MIELRLIDLKNKLKLNLNSLRFSVQGGCNDVVYIALLKTRYLLKQEVVSASTLAVRALRLNGY